MAARTAAATAPCTCFAECVTFVVEAGRKSAANRVIRGGSWNDDARNVRAAYRNHDDPADRNDNLGFRCARAHERVGGPRT